MYDIFKLNIWNKKYYELQTQQKCKQIFYFQQFFFFATFRKILNYK